MAYISVTCENCKRTTRLPENYTRPWRCGCPNKVASPHKTTTIFCSHKHINICELASTLASRPIEICESDCIACCATSSPRKVNEVTLALAGLEEKTTGPGTRLANLISWFIPHGPCQACTDRIRIMNAWGYERCRKEVPTILEWLRDSAHRKGLPYNEYVIAAVLKTLLK